MSTIELELTNNDTTWSATARLVHHHAEVAASTPLRAAVGAVSTLITKVHKARQKHVPDASIDNILPVVIVVPDFVGPLDTTQDPAVERNARRIIRAGAVWHVHGTGPIPACDPYVPDLDMPVKPTKSGRRMDLSKRTADVRHLPWAVLDIEATSYGTDRKILEIAIRRYVGRELVDTFHTFVDPQRPLTERDLFGHRVRERHLTHAPVFADIADTVAELLSGCVVVGHSVIRDVELLRGEYSRLGQHTPRYPLLDTYVLWKTATYCSSGSLRDLAEHYKVTPAGPWHFAATDAEANAEVAFCCLDDTLTPGQYLYVEPPAGKFITHPVRPVRRTGQTLVA